ncbi:DUF1848 domain-containing protein [Pectinatus haikarae]|uniref:DNA repair photolyase n=1 Tax=Pectinatus haikarae TaxID=349096 RepID=A0ABT9Y5V9_9FIRM|nr:DUF1848 domain-containing protein [Pectinatus haikarae]MDQ0203215.1 DNA repair photolyase [Pectinatus haikarae]
MIVSASRRTDIPAFYSSWLLNRLREGYVLVPNPRNLLNYSRVELRPETVDCFVFWTKNPAPMLPKLNEIAAMGYPFYFQFTLTPYDREIEKYLPSKTILIQTFRDLSRLIGAEKVIWRYDPIICTKQINSSWHLEQFNKIAAALEGYTNRCIFSFVDFYAKIRKNLQNTALIQMQESAMLRIAEGFSKIARKHKIRLATCCEAIELQQYGIEHAACIDAKLIENILGCSVRSKKDTNQRPGCGCMESVEIGTYDSCPHGCIYCYAASSTQSGQYRAAFHAPTAPVLLGPIPKAAVITKKKMLSVKEQCQRLFFIP